MLYDPSTCSSVKGTKAKKAEAMTDLVAEIESVFDEIPNDGVAANTLSVSSQPDNGMKKDTETATPSNQGTKSRIFAGCRIECKIMEAGVKVSSSYCD